MSAAGLTKEALRRLIWRARVVELADKHFAVTSELRDRIRCGDVATLVSAKLGVANSWRHRRECRQAVADLGCKRVTRAEGITYYVGLRAR